MFASDVCRNVHACIVNTRLQSFCERWNSCVSVTFPSGVESFAKSEVVAQDVRRGENEIFLFYFHGKFEVICSFLANGYELFPHV